MAERMPGFFDIDERLRELSAKGDDLERINELFDFENAPPRSRSSGSPAPIDRRAVVRRSMACSCSKC
jgi:hypothetical protein